MSITSHGPARIDIIGNFAIHAPDGQQIEISEKKGRALLVMLAVSPDMRRSRSWLKTQLWSRTGNPQCSYSLRQTLFKLKGAIDPHCEILKADREFVWLEDTVVGSAESQAANAQFFEDAAVYDPNFRTWLLTERALFEKGRGLHLVA